MTVIQMLHSQLSQRGSIRGRIDTFIVPLEDGEQVTQSGFVTKTQHIVNGVRRYPLKRFVVFLVKAGEEERQRARNTNCFELFRRELGLPFNAETFSTIIFGFNFTRFGVDELFFGRHCRNGSHTTDRLHPSTTLAHSCTNHQITGKFLVLPSHGSYLPAFLLVIQDGTNSAQISCTRLPSWSLHVIINRSLQIKLSSNDMHQHRNFHPRSKPFCQLGQGL
mmetsp:Transcript_20612/g.44521  ORF Transcript_20612/g.44521 Transcript_20612/m.44521 type:complete len:221 (-) Transcript_20612:1139-1801(-)